MSPSCTNCGSPGWSQPGPCGICGFRAFRELSLITNDGLSVAIGRLETPVGRSWAARFFGDEARYWDSPQMTFEPWESGWRLLPNCAAANATLLNGITVSEPVELEDGMVLSVGNETKAIQKTPMRIKLA